MKGLWVLALCLGACGGAAVEDAPLSLEARREPERTMPGQEDAYDLVRSTFMHGMGLAELLEDAPSVRWSEALCPTPSADGTQQTAVFDAEGRCYAGLAYDGCDLRVAWRGKFSRSAYAHEIMHCLLNRAGRRDSEHTGEPAAWRLVEAADQALAARGL